MFLDQHSGESDDGDDEEKSSESSADDSSDEKQSNSNQNSGSSNTSDVIGEENEESNSLFAPKTPTWAPTGMDTDFGNLPSGLVCCLCLNLREFEDVDGLMEIIQCDKYVHSTQNKMTFDKCNARPKMTHRHND